MLDKLKTALVLVVIGAISGFLIYQTNELTKDTIAESRYNQELDFYRGIFDLDETISFEPTFKDLENGMEEITLTNLDTNEIIGYVYKGSETNNYGDITVLVGILSDGEIADVVISKSTNTPTYVKAVKDDDLPYFSEKASDTMTAEKINTDVDSGATYTFGSVQKFVLLATEYYNTERGELND